MGVEQSSGGGGHVDVVVETDRRRTLYEIKTAATARGCIREAVGQLLDYALWAEGPLCTRICVVGEPAPDERTATHLQKLNARFPVELAYRQVRI